MKRIALCLLALLGCITFADAQTYYYKLTSKVDKETEVRNSYYGEVYVTFTNGKNICYESNKDGNSLNEFAQRQMSFSGYGFPYNTSCDHIFKYSSRKDNMRIYSCKFTLWSAYPYSRRDGGTYFVCFSDDFKRINIQKGGSIIVGEQTDFPGTAKGPSKMW